MSIRAWAVDAGAGGQLTQTYHVRQGDEVGGVNQGIGIAL